RSLTRSPSFSNERTNRRSAGRPGSTVLRSLATQLHRDRTAVAGGLIPDAVVRHSGPVRAERVRVADLERVETAADHEVQLLEQHVSDRPQLFAVSVPLAKQARVGVRAPVPKLRKLEHDHVEIPN